ncbi:MAG: single-stranded DNA-binding protein, partial [Chloroflexota bacterium]|nr:single-stranded DNA-binding protein [Chloroflexota bacterium]
PLNRWQGIGTVGADVQPFYDKRAHESTITIAAFDLILAGETTSSEEDRLSNRLPCWAHGRLAEQCLDWLTPGCQVYVEGRLEITMYTRPYSSYDPSIVLTRVLLLGGREMTDD